MGQTLQSLITAIESRRTPARGEFRIDNVCCRFYIGDVDTPLVVTFSPATADTAVGGAIPCEVWGMKFVEKHGLNSIAFACVANRCWYRSPELHDALIRLGKHLGAFPKILGYGISMGGYGISAAAGPLGVTDLLLINPVSTLNPDLVPFETKRRTDEQALDWHGRFHDGADAKCGGYILYDPLLSTDRSHAQRYTSLMHLRTPGMGHAVTRHLKEMDLLAWLFDSFLEGDIPAERFYRNIRQRRLYPAYYKNLLKTANHLTPARKAIILKHQAACTPEPKPLPSKNGPSRLAGKHAEKRRPVLRKLIRFTERSLKPLFADLREK